MISNILVTGNFWGAFLNVLGIVGLILLALFIVVFVSDWILSTIDGKEGIFFKKNRNQVNNTTNITNNYGDNYQKVDESTPVVRKEVEEQETIVQDEVDFDKARQEEEALSNEKDTFTFSEPVEEVVEEAEAEIEPDLDILDENAYDAYIDEISDIAFKSYNDLKAEEANAINDSKEEINEEISKQNVEQPIDEIVEEVAISEPIEDEIEEPVEEEVESIEEESIEEEIEEPETEVESTEVQEIEEKVEENTDIQDNNESVQNAILQRLEEQINALQEQLEAQRKENEELKRLAEEEKARLNDIIKNRSGINDDDRKIYDYVGNLDELEARLEVLKDRLKANEKELRLNKKEFIPLSRVKKTLESDKKKLRRREAIVAKRKVLLYGVNNYADIDEEKAKELNEELDLLEGLRLSVAHCEEVMESNKDRYPILEHTNKILTETNAQIKADIAQVEEEIELAKNKDSQNDDNE